MLPLWIIDLTSKSSRNVHFVNDLLGKTKGVFIKSEGSQESDKNETCVTDGDFCWYYSRYNSDIFDCDLSLFNDLTEKTGEEIRLFSDKVYEFQGQLVRDGQEYVKMIRHSSLKAYTSLNICVLGDATEEFSQLLFPSVALLLQKEKGRMLANHIHQGMSVIGALFVPSSINSEEVTIRENVLRTLMEVDVQHKVSTVPGYDHVILYQDVQNRYEKYYSLLNEKEQAEFIFQCLVHMYYACNTQHPLISGVAAADSFYISLGVASLMFDDDLLGRQTGAKVCNGMLSAFYATPKNDNYLETAKERAKERILVSDSCIDPKNILDFFRLPEINLEEVKTDIPAPHPILNFSEKYLKNRYYRQFLSNSVAEFRRKMDDEIEKSTRASLEVAHNSFARKLDDFQRITMPSTIMQFIEKSNPSDGGIPYLESLLKDFKEKLAIQKKRISDYVEKHVWIPSFSNIPLEYQDYYSNYHEAYKSDIEANNGDKYANEMKNAAIADLCNHQKQETAILSRLARTFLLGLVSVIFLLPLVNLIFPDSWHIRQTAGIWAGICFALPVLIELFIAVRYLVKRERKFNKLRGFSYHDAYARVANRIVSESQNYYDKLMALCDRYLERTEIIRKEVYGIQEEEVETSNLPFTKFNQPLVNGDFCGQVILTESALETKQIYVNHRKVPVDSLTEENYFSLIHLLKHNFVMLFNDVRIREEHPYENMNDGSGTVRLLSEQDVENRERESWEKIKSDFETQFLQNVKNELVPLQYPSACEMIMQSFAKDRNKSIVQPFVEFAATNGEFTTSANIEYADVKTLSDKIKELFDEYIPKRAIYQNEDAEVEKTGRTVRYCDRETMIARALFKKHIFLTRWYSYENISLNRILPMEDFDIEERKRQVNETDLDPKKKRCDKTVSDFIEVAGETDSVVDDAQISVGETTQTETLNNGNSEIKKKNEGTHPISASSTLLWSLCEKDNSILWLKLFHTDILNKARSISEDVFNKTLTQKD